MYDLGQRMARDSILRITASSCLLASSEGERAEQDAALFAFTLGDYSFVTYHGPIVRNT